MREKPTLLYVDDEPINLMLFEAQFSGKYNVFTAKSGDDGLAELRKNPTIRFVISDMRMPGMNGIQFISLAKKEFPTIKYSILTGFDLNDEISNALNCNLIFKYFRKPFAVHEIEVSIEEVLA